MKCSARTRRTAGGRTRGTSVFPLRSFVLASIFLVGGCVAPERVPEQTPPPVVQIPERIWWQVDGDIGAASLAAAETAENDAREALEDWKARVTQRTEQDFIPWFTSYWTQQWLAVKLAWYKLNAEEGLDSAILRLAAYLEEQYQDRVLNPVAREIDPDGVREEATRLYVRSLGDQIRGIGRRYGLPQDRFDRHLEAIPAIALAAPPGDSASLYQVVHTDPITRLPAYVALMARIRKDAGGAGGGPLNARASPMARRSSERLAATLAGSGAGAAAAVFGGIAGMMISLGAAGFGAIAHDQQRPAMEAQLRQDLGAAVDDMSLQLMEDRATGVMAGVHHMSGQIQEALGRAVPSPIEFDPAPQVVPLSGE